MRIFERKKELQQIQKVLTSSKSEFLYLRGRRRVGKSWLLAELQKAQRASFLFTGQADASAKQTLKNMVQQWSIFSSTNALLYRASAFLNWQSVFEEMLHFAQSKQSKITLIFDEIQWIAKKNTGFIGALKTAWVSWQQSNLINVIVCGSSNKFFHDHVGGEEKILRGLQTAATLWVHPIELQRVREEFAPDWNFQEVALLYMMIGGVPYYLERVDTTLPFIHAVNGAFFTKARNLLNEPEELLGLEFNRLGRSNALRILAALGQAGSSQKNIAYKTGIEKSTVSKLVRSLTDYQLVFSRIPYQRSRYENEDFERYYMKDYFLNWYFQSLRLLEKDILLNESGLLFPGALDLSTHGYYVPNFSGGAFELLVRRLLEDAQDFSSLFFQKLLLSDAHYTVHDYWDHETQIDIVVDHPKDRVLRVVDCKWSERWNDAWLAEIRQKRIPVPKFYSRRDYLLLPKIPHDAALFRAARQGVEIVALEDLLRK